MKDGLTNEEARKNLRKVVLKPHSNGPFWFQGCVSGSGRDRSKVLVVVEDEHGNLHYFDYCEIQFVDEFPEEK